MSELKIGGAPLRELGYAESTSQQALISTEADVTGLTITFTAGIRPIVLEAYVAGSQQVTSTGIPVVKITDGSNTQQVSEGQASTAASAFTPAYNPKVRLSTLTPGTSYTFKVRASTTAGTLTIIASATQKAFIRASEV